MNMLCSVKYCGGCQSTYDRAAFLKKLTEECPGIDFVYHMQVQNHDGAFLLFICGCPARCALTGKGNSENFIVAASAEDCEQVKDKLMMEKLYHTLKGTRGRI